MTQPLRCRQILTCRTSRAGARPSQYFRAASKACRRRATAASVGGSQCKGGSEGWAAAAAAAGVSPPAAAGVPSGSEAGVPCLSLAAWASAAAARQLAGSGDQHSRLYSVMRLVGMLVQSQLPWSEGRAAAFVVREGGCAHGAQHAGRQQCLLHGSCSCWGPSQQVGRRSHSAGCLNLCSAAHEQAGSVARLFGSITCEARHGAHKSRTDYRPEQHGYRLTQGRPGQGHKLWRA